MEAARGRNNMGERARIPGSRGWRELPEVLARFARGPGTLERRMARRSYGAIRSRFIPLVLKYVAARGGDPAALARQLGFSPDVSENDALPWRLVADVGDAAAQMLRDPYLGLHMAEAFSVTKGVYGAFEFLGRTAIHLGQAFERLVRYQRLINERIRLAVRVRGGSAVFENQMEGVPLGELRHSNEFLICRIVGHVRELGDPGFAPREVWFAHPQPKRIARLVTHLGCDRLHFGHDRNAFSFPKSVLALPIRTASPELAAVLDEFAKVLMLKIPDTFELLDAVRHHIQTELPQRSADVHQIARRLHMSTRTLQRRLSEHDTSFQEVLDQVRHELARQHLASKQLSTGEIAYLLGYADTRTFVRASKRWPSG
ncbi:MAG TPA: AraC family transcriptional regulator ligand-binding domain-containing protein [Kofleriaceae bacterium]|nr:AraC family transcriptional regulator ligand-binding domain-containing protein [Kofleriaceae bacterium]